MENKKKMISVDNVCMTFNMNRERIVNLKELVIRKAKRNLEKPKEFHALSNVSFDVSEGEFIGIVGLNGSGKSTLLKIIAGVMKPTAGSSKTFGSVAPLIELGAGFNPALSGRENIYMNGYVLGFTKKFLIEHMDEIIDFSELGDFIDIPMNNYSSGMRARLGFAIATTVRPQILIVDEVLAVGDYKFQEKCRNRMQEMLANNTTVLFVSHSIQQVRDMCTRCIWLEKGKVVADGATTEVCDRFMGEKK